MQMSKKMLLCGDYEIVNVSENTLQAYFSQPVQ